MLFSFFRSYRQTAHSCTFNLKFLVVFSLQERVFRRKSVLHSCSTFLLTPIFGAKRFLFFTLYVYISISFEKYAKQHCFHCLFPRFFHPLHSWIHTETQRFLVCLFFSLDSLHTYFLHFGIVMCSLFVFFYHLHKAFREVHTDLVWWIWEKANVVHKYEFHGLSTI